MAWSQAAGGIANDEAFGVAVSGSSVYLTGYVFNSQTDYYSVAFGGSGATLGTVTQAGASTATSNDLVLAKYTNNGSSATFRWSQMGGTKDGQGTSVTVAGTLSNTAANAQNVLFGGSSTTVDAAAQYGASGTTAADQVLAKYTDNGATASLAWSQVGGGTSYDGGAALAVSGANVYVTGHLTNGTTNSAQVLFGGSGLTAGTAPQYGAVPGNTQTLVVAKYVDQGSSASLG